MGLFGKKKPVTRSNRTLSEAFFFVVEDRRPGHEKTFTPATPKSRQQGSSGSSAAPPSRGRDTDDYDDGYSSSRRDDYDDHSSSRRDDDRGYSSSRRDDYYEEEEYSAPARRRAPPKVAKSPKPRGKKPAAPKPRGPKPAGRSLKPEMRNPGGRKKGGASAGPTNKVKELELKFKRLRSEYEAAKDDNDLKTALDLKRELKKFPLEIDDAIDDLRSKYKRIRDTNPSKASAIKSQITKLEDLYDTCS